MNPLVESLLSLFFPPLCVHCQDLTSALKTKLCPTCLEQMSLLEVEGRCRRCFAETENGACQKCRKRGSPFRRMAAAFEYTGPAAALVQQLKFGRRQELAKDLAAWMVVQFMRLEVPLPDIIVPVPQPLARTLTRGFSQSLLLARELGTLLDRPVMDLLKKKSGDFPQTGLTRAQRESLAADAISWKSHCSISDKIVLLVDDVMTTGSTLRLSGRTLEEGFPAALYALTFCITE